MNEKKQGAENRKKSKKTAN